MTKVKIKKNNLERLKRQIRTQVRAKANKTLPNIIYEQVIEKNILRGKSPAQGGGRFKKYSKSYMKAIRSGRYGNQKRITPVNMFLNGDMIGSFAIDEIKNGFRLSFSDEKARWHQLGKGRLPSRLLLPTKGGKTSRFNRRITRAINNELIRLIKRVSAKMRLKRYFGF